MSNIRGLGPVKKHEKKADEEEFGSMGATSGTSTYRPTNRDAQGNVIPSSTSSSGNAPMSDFINAVRQQQGQQGGQPQPEQSVGTITVYANGFIIGNSEFYDISDPKNRALLEQLKQGEMPPELQAVALKEWGNVSNMASVGIQLVDKSADTYTPPKKPFDFSKSSGQSLGGVSDEQKAATLQTFSNAQPQRVETDPSQPTTTIALQLKGRPRSRETFNEHITVLQLYQHIMSLTGEDSFELLSGFPPKPLTKPSATLREAGLINAQVQQR